MLLGEIIEQGFFIDPFESPSYLNVWSFLCYFLD